MRRGWVAVGALLTVVGALLAYLPLTSTTSASSTVGAGEEVIFSISSPLGTYGTQLDLFHPYIEVTVSWSATAPIVVEVFGCGRDANCTNATRGAPLASGNASSGSISFKAQSGVYYAALPRAGSSGAAQLTVDDLGPLAGGLPGMVLFAMGLVVLIAGLVRSPPEPLPPPEEEDEPKELAAQLSRD
ncbi:MAG: hypothetical protein L3J72_00550 [Thermoplasmata archaeon]|nr:hypothetical protein [Thermoplasmata archaeon]